jgi:hypothetical protein
VKPLRGAKNLYETTFSLAQELYGTRTFCPFDAERGEWEPKPHRAFYDAVMVGISCHLDHREQLLARKDAVVEATERLFRDHPDGTFTGRGNTKADVQERIGLFTAMLDQTLRS